MPRGKYVNHKGRSRHFTSPEEMEEELKNDTKKKYRKPKDENKSESSSEEDEGSASVSGSDEEDSEDDEDKKTKGVESLIEIENPNRAPKKAVQKVTAVKVGEKAPKPELSRREREEVEKQRAQAHYQKLHAEGKTEQARADLARLAIIKQHRAEAAARREAEKKEKETKKGASTSK